MDPVTRRGFFKKAGAATAVAAVAGVTATIPGGVAGALASRGQSEAPLLKSEELATGTELIAHVENARTGVIRLFFGQREVTLRDRGLAARLVRAAK